MLLRRHAVQRLLHIASRPPPISLRPAVLRTCTIIRAYHRPTITTRLGEFQASRPTSRHGFEVAIICALPLEADAVDAVLDLRWDDDGPPFDKASGDPNAYTTGAIGRHNVVLAHMPGMGKASAAAVAAHCRASFPNVKLALVVGVCGVVPFGPNGEEIALGDVIISDGVVQYDFGRQLVDRFVRKDTLVDSLGRPNPEIRGVLAKLRGLRGRKLLGGKMASYLDDLRLEPLLGAERPETTDGLLKPSPDHEGNKQPARSRSPKTITRKRSQKNVQSSRDPNVHFGLIASGDSVIKSGRERDAIATAEGVIAFEMEGAGIWENLPCIVIKGACDYADSYKNKLWQRYAAATAAACMKAFLSYWVPSLPPGSTLEASNPIRRQGVYFIPYPKNAEFVQRTEVAETLKDMLFTDNDTDSLRVALVGLGGIGKTQLALHLAHWVRDNKSEHSVLWIPAFSMASFEEACIEILKTLDIPRREGEDVKVLVRDYLSSDKSGSWFLIVDNADDVGVFEGILDFLPHNDFGRVLLTTRSQEVAVMAAGSAVIRMPEMSEVEAFDFLHKALIDKAQLHDRDLVVELLGELTYLPLAIAQAAAYLNMNQVSIKEYLRIFQNTDQDMIELLSSRFRNNMHYFNTQGAIATTWIISFNQICDNNEIATRLLSYLSCIEPKAIPRSLLPNFDTEQKMTKAIGTLCGYGFLTQRGDDSMFDMHSLVHLATRIWTENQGNSDRAREDVIEHLASVFPIDTWEYRSLWRQYLPHALKALAARRGISTTYFNLGNYVARCLTKDERGKESIDLLQDLMEIWEVEGERDDHRRMIWQLDLAAAHQAAGQYQEAIILLEDIVAVQESTKPPEETFCLLAEHELARAYLATGQVKKAKDLQEHVVKTQRRILDENDRERLVSESVLAAVYEQGGLVKESIELLEDVIEKQGVLFAVDDPTLKSTRHQLARVYQIEGRAKEAVRLMNVEAGVPTTIDEREDFFVKEVELGERIMLNPQLSLSNPVINAAFCFFKGLKVYPNPNDLIRIYNKTVTKDVLDVLSNMVAQDPTIDINVPIAPISNESNEDPQNPTE